MTTLEISLICLLITFLACLAVFGICAVIHSGWKRRQEEVDEMIAQFDERGAKK